MRLLKQLIDRRVARGLWQSHLRRLSDDEAGAAAILVALLFPVLVGGMGLGAETGYWHLMQRNLQHAADVAAHAGGVRKRAGEDLAMIESAALHIATASGFSPSGGTIVVNSPPQSGAFVDDENSVEVLLTTTQRRLFSALFNQQPVTIGGRAVARFFGEGGAACVLALSTTAPEALQITGSGSISLIGCDLASNSEDSASFSMPNNASSAAAGCVHTVGSAEVHNPANLSLSECERVNEYAPPVLDPYADVEEPSLVNGACESSNTVGKQNESTTLTPTFNHSSGMKSMRFCGGLTVRGDVTFGPGLYFIEGGDVEADFTSGGNSSMAGEGVVFFLKNARIKLNSNLTSQFSAPTSGPYAGILFFGSRADTSTTHTINGTASSFWEGAIYAPSSAVVFQGNASSAGGCTQIVANTVTLSGNTSLEHDCTEAGTRDIVISQRVQLVE